LVSYNRDQYLPIVNNRLKAFDDFPSVLDGGERKAVDGGEKTRNDITI
jgi:hypothetical protein